MVAVLLWQQMLSPTSRSKGRAARWRFWCFVFIKVRRLRFAFVSGAPLTVTLDRSMSTYKIKSIDIVAVCFSIILAALITVIASAIIALLVTSLAFANEADIDNSGAGGILIIFLFFTSAFFLSPLWIWLALKLRKVINWPKGAFEGIDLTNE